MNDKILRWFYEDVITFDRYIEVRLQHTDGWWKSVYASTYDELTKILKNNDSYNIYVGVNPRKTKGKRDIDCTHLRTFYFDVEHTGDKPPLTHKTYRKELLSSVKTIITCLRKWHGLTPSAVVISGRGLHVYYSIAPLAYETIKQRYKQWFKKTTARLEEHMPYDHIKCSDSVYNIGRIASAPGTRHKKYPEQPLREIIYHRRDVHNDLLPVLENITKKSFSSTVSKHKKAKKYTEETIFTCPEFKILEDYDDLPEGELHNCVIFAIKLLMKANGLTNYQEMRDALSELGYENEVIEIPESSEYVYRTSIFMNWLCKHYRWCVEHNYTLPYKIAFFYDHTVAKVSDRLDAIEQYIPFEQITTFDDLLEFVRDFNTQTCVKQNDAMVFFEPVLRRIVEEHVDPVLVEFVDMNDLWKKIAFIRAR